jgi:hypothetical protein
MKILSGTLSIPIPPHPFDTMARTPASRTASNMRFVRARGSPTTIEPNPMYTGGGPFSRNAAKSSGGVYDDAVLRKEKPVTFKCSGQSDGLAIRL